MNAEKEIKKAFELGRQDMFKKFQGKCIYSSSQGKCFRNTTYGFKCCFKKCPLKVG